MSRFTSALLILLMMTACISWGQASTDAQRSAPSVSHAQVMQMYQQGDYEQAYKHAQHRREWGDEKLNYPLGVMLLEGWGTQRDLYLARQFLEMAAKQGELDAMFRLANMYKLGDGGNIDKSKACEWFKKAAHKRTDARYELALCYRSGLGIAKDDALALNMLHTLAARGHRLALKTLKLEYMRQAQQRGIPDGVAYAQAQTLALNGKFEEARRAAISTIEGGDYRGYAALAYALEHLGKTSKEQLDDMYAIGGRFGSPLSIYGGAQHLQQKDHLGAACKQYSAALAAGLKRAGMDIARCYMEGHLPSHTPDEDACVAIDQATNDNYPPALLAKADCLLSSTSPSTDDRLQAIRLYAQGVKADATLANPNRALSLCGELPQRMLRESNSSNLVCVLKQDDPLAEIFAPHSSVITKANPSQLLPIRDINGLRLSGLTRDEVRKQITQRKDLMAVELSDERDVITLNNSEGKWQAQWLMQYHSDGGLQAFTQRQSGLDEADFNQRVKALNDDFNLAASLRSDKRYLAAQWSLPGWSISLLQDLKSKEVRERYVVQALP